MQTGQQCGLNGDRPPAFGSVARLACLRLVVVAIGGAVLLSACGQQSESQQPPGQQQSASDEQSRKDADEKAWTEAVSAGTAAAFNGYIQNFASGAHVAEARSVLQDAVKRWPDELAFTLQLASASQQAGDVPAAETALKELAARPRWKDSVRPALALAELYTEAHKLDQAESVLRAAAVKNPDSPDIELKLSQALVGQDKLEEALKVLEPHQELLPLSKARAELLLNMKRGAQAIQEPAQRGVGVRDLARVGVLRIARPIRLRRRVRFVGIVEMRPGKPGGRLQG